MENAIVDVRARRTAVCVLLTGRHTVHLIYLLASAAVHLVVEWNALLELFVLFVTSLALILRVLLSVWGSTVARDTTKATRIQLRRPNIKVSFLCWKASIDLLLLQS